jgi:hypothetical protein
VVENGGGVVAGVGLAVWSRDEHYGDGDGGENERCQRDARSSARSCPVRMIVRMIVIMIVRVIVIV